MGTTVERDATQAEIRHMQQNTARAGCLNSGAVKAPFVFFAAFDGSNDDRNNLDLSGNPFQTNVANLYDMAQQKEGKNLVRGYYPGVGTGGKQGNIINAGIAPTGPLEAAARKALNDFAQAARDYQSAAQDFDPGHLCAVTVGFSRGNAAQVLFARMLDTEGLALREPGSAVVVAPPGTVKVSALVMLDPVYTSINGNLSLPPSVLCTVLELGALDEVRREFKRADYSRDSRVHLLEMAGNHCGVGGGYDQHGTAAAALACSVSYLRGSGLDLGPVPRELAFHPDEPAKIYNELYMTNPDGSIAKDDQGNPKYAWFPFTVGSPGHRATDDFNTTVSTVDVPTYFGN